MADLEQWVLHYRILSSNILAENITFNSVELLKNKLWNWRILIEIPYGFTFVNQFKQRFRYLGKHDWRPCGRFRNLFKENYSWIEIGDMKVKISGSEYRFSPILRLHIRKIGYSCNCVTSYSILIGFPNYQPCNRLQKQWPFRRQHFQSLRITRSTFTLSLQGEWMWNKFWKGRFSRFPEPNSYVLLNIKNMFQ